MIEVLRYLDPPAWLDGCNACHATRVPTTVVTYGDPDSSAVARFCDDCVAGLVRKLVR